MSSARTHPRSPPRSLPPPPQAGLLTDGRKVAIVAPNPDTVKKAQIFRHGLIDAWRDAQRVSFAMFSRAPVVEGSRLHHEM